MITVMFNKLTCDKFTVYYRSYWFRYFKLIFLMHLFYCYCFFFVISLCYWTAIILVLFSNIILPTTKKLTTKGLRILKNHNVVKIQVDFLNCTITELVDSLSEWTTQNLKILSVPNSLYVSDSWWVFLFIYLCK